MKTIQILEPSDVKYLRIDVGPRYWEDSEINGEEDISFEEQKKGVKPRMPFAVEEEKGNYKEYRWQIEIDIDEMKVINWPDDISALIHYKVCDDGTYYLLDKEKNILEEKNCYVPSILSYIDEGWGDYIIMAIDKGGKLIGFPNELKDDLLQKLIDTKSF